MRLKDIFHSKSIQAVMISATFLIPNHASITPPAATTPTYVNNAVSTVVVENKTEPTAIELPQIADDYNKPTRSPEHVAYSVNPAKTAPAPAPAPNAITVAGRTVPTFYTDSTKIDAGDRVARYGEHFLFGHNTSNVFGGLNTLGIGSTFIITENGSSKVYRVTYTETMEKPTVQNFMGAIVDGRFRGNRYDTILMTCAGTSLGNGDATHRLLIFANLIN